MNGKIRKSVQAIGQVVGALLGEDVVIPAPRTVREIPAVRYVV